MFLFFLVRPLPACLVEVSIPRDHRGGACWPPLRFCEDDLHGLSAAVHRQLGLEVSVGVHRCPFDRLV